jgi:purine catabolism regulator
MADVLTVRAALELEAFRRTDWSVLTGEDGLDRPVRWVHTGELPDIHRFLAGQEMLLTAGLGMGSTPQLQRAYVRRLADAHAAVLVVELAGRMFDSMPDAVVDEARLVGLPLVGVRDEISFAEVSAQLHELLMELRVDRLISEEATGQAFMDLLLAGEDYVGMVKEVARRTSRPVVLEDVAHQMLAYAGTSTGADASIADWAGHARAIHEPALPTGRAAPTAKAGSCRDVVACARRPVVLRGESWGWLHLLHGPARPSPSDLRALERAAAAVAITLLGDRESGARTAQRQSTLINRLQLGDISGEMFVERALALGQDLRRMDLIVVVTVREVDGATCTDRDLALALREANRQAVVGDIGDFDLAVVGIPSGATDTELGALLRRTGACGGVSRVVSPTGLPAAIGQGRSAAAAAAAGRTKQILRFDELGVLRLLVALADGPELSRYVADELGPLLEYDTLATHPLLPTLRAFLACGGNKAQASEALFVQRRTLYHRLDRLSAVIGLDLADVEVQQRLQLAVRGHDLLHRPVARTR